MEAVGRVAAKVPLRVQGVASDGLSASSLGGGRRCCSTRLTGNVSGLSLHRSRKTGELKSDKRIMDDNFICSRARGPVRFSYGFEDVAEEGRHDSPTSGHGVSGRDSWFWAGAAGLLASLEVQGVMVMHALASESESGGNSQAADSAVSAATDAAATVVSAASRAPSWLSSAIVAFPLFSYFLFGLYREKVNPAAKVTDWLFTLVAVGIVANIVMQVTWGVRLY